MPAQLAHAPSTAPLSAPELVHALLEVAHAEWLRDIREAPHTSAARIDTYIRDPRGLHWTWVKPYRRDGQFEWCGAFAAFCFGHVGLKHDLRYRHLASTYRLFRWAAEDQRARFVAPADLRPGDIGVVGPRGDRDGAHIVLCTAVTPEGIHTFEGNARGPGPDGTRRPGVTRDFRPFAHAAATDQTYRVVFGVRPLAGDYEALA